jgi:hypothetical protein
MQMVGTVGAAVATGAFYDALRFMVSQVQTEYNIGAAAADTTEAFRAIFGYVSANSGPFDYTLGRPKYRKGPYSPYSTDNWAAGVALARPLGLDAFSPVSSLPTPGIPLHRKGDLFVVGGVNSTDETMIAWEFDGPNDLQLRRPQRPILPLRWHYLADITEPSLRDAVPLAYSSQNSQAKAVLPWPIVEVDPAIGTVRRLLMPEASTVTVTVQGNRISVPRNNYVIITRLPNFLAPEFGRPHPPNHSRKPSMLVIEGTNGIGTRAVELLTTSRSGRDAILRAETALSGSKAFQVLFRVQSPLLDRRGAHRFQEIEFVDFHTMDLVQDETLLRAHDMATHRLEARRPSWVRVDDEWVRDWLTEA